MGGTAQAEAAQAVFLTVVEALQGKLTGHHSLVAEAESYTEHQAIVAILHLLLIVAVEVEATTQLGDAYGLYGAEGLAARSYLEVAP